MVHRADALEHFWEVSHHVGDHLGVADNFKQIFVTNEVESGEVLPLLLKVLSKCFLNHLQRICKILKSFLKIWNLHHFKDDGSLVHNFHEASKLSVDVFKLSEFV